MGASSGEWFPKRTIGGLPREAAQQWGAREALMFQGRRWTFAQFEADVQRAAKALMGLGVQAGGGNVADSEPTYEWNETLNKARALAVAVEVAERGLAE